MGLFYCKLQQISTPKKKKKPGNLRLQWDFSPEMTNTEQPVYAYTGRFQEEDLLVWRVVTQYWFSRFRVEVKYKLVRFLHFVYVCVHINMLQLKCGGQRRVDSLLQPLRTWESNSFTFYQLSHLTNPRFLIYYNFISKWLLSLQSNNFNESIYLL